MCVLHKCVSVKMSPSTGNVSGALVKYSTIILVLLASDVGLGQIIRDVDRSSPFAVSSEFIIRF